MNERIICLFFFISIAQSSGYSQSQLACDCREANRILALRGFTPDYSASHGQKIINAYTSVFKNPLRIHLVRSECQSQSSLHTKICDSPNGPIHVIFYRQQFMNDLASITSSGDEFLLAHEIAHSILGHNERDYRSVLGNPRLNLDKVIQGASLDSLNVQQHHELEADALAFWLVVREKKLTPAQVQEIFQKLPELLALHVKGFSEKISSPTHPALFSRRLILNRVIKKMATDKKFQQLFAESSTTGSFDPLMREIKEMYAFHLASLAKEQVDQLEAYEKELRANLIRQSRFSVDIVGAGLLQKPVLTRSGVNIPSSSVLATFGVGGRLGLGSWLHKHRVALDILWSRTQFNSYDEQNENRQTVESFQIDALRVRPRYIYSFLSHRAASSNSWMLSLGASLLVPTRQRYLHYLINPAQTPLVGKSIQPALGLGWGKGNRVYSSNFKQIWLIYEPQVLSFNVAANQAARARLHTLNLEISFRLR